MIITPSILQCLFLHKIKEISLLGVGYHATGVPFHMYTVSWIITLFLISNPLISNEARRFASSLGTTINYTLGNEEKTADMLSI